VGPEVYDRIVFDLALIRDFEPSLLGQTHSPVWLANERLVRLDPGAPQDEYPCLNDRYQLINADNLFGDWWVLTFAGNINVPALAQVYMQAPEVQFAEPNGLIGGQNFWTPTDHGASWIRDVDDGWYDCFDGCDCHRLYKLGTTAAGGIRLLSFEEFGAPWCEFD
jgi:hypothetical protein